VEKFGDIRRKEGLQRARIRDTRKEKGQKRSELQRCRWMER
jgi:hypothetical protein